MLNGEAGWWPFAGLVVPTLTGNIVGSTALFRFDRLRAGHERDVNKARWRTSDESSQESQVLHRRSLS
jgi:hypothetical protein